jgi:uncharacterized protein YggE
MQIANPWGVSAFGAGSVKAQPDLARIRFRVNRLEQTPAAAFRVASEAVRAVRQSLRRHGIPDAAVAGSRLDLQSDWSYADRRRTLLGYKCEASFAVEHRNLDDLQPLLVDLVDAGADMIEAVDFDVSAKAGLRADARRNAVVAARRKAELYAEAAGITLGPVVHIDDVDPEQDRLNSHRSHGGGGATTEGDLAPGHVVVSAAVVLGFAIG